MLVLHFALLTILATGSLAVLKGKQATPHQFPYHVGLYDKYMEQPIEEVVYFCGGTLLSERWVLTSAKCITSKDQIFIKAGKHVVDEEEEASEQTRSVVRHVIHPEYEEAFKPDGLIAQNDIAMISVDEPFVFNEYVSAAEVPSTSAYFDSGFLAGWGASSMKSGVPTFPYKLHYNLGVKIINTKNCTDAISKGPFDIGLSSVTIDNKHICSSINDGRACYKDDGSAFVSREDSMYVIIGIVSETIFPCENVEFPGIYTRVSAYSDWMREVINAS